MNNIEILANALEYIENNLQKEIKTKDVADACYCSKSALEKMFRCIENISVREYIIRRRMMLAAKLIASDSKLNLLDVAYACGYGTNESFSRAFKSVWNCNPLKFKQKEKFSELFPRLYPPIQDGGVYINMRKNVDISEMYELFVQRKNCWFVCCDIKSLAPINEVSIKAGDLAILEAMNRMVKEAGEEDIVFRIGGDEFVMLTNSEELSYAEGIKKRIGEYDGETFKFEDREFPLELHCNITKFQGNALRYRDLFEHLHIAILENK